MIILRDKYFAVQNRQEGLRDLSTYCDRVCIEIIKLVELYDNYSGEDLKHWIGMTGTFINNVLDSEVKISVNSSNSPQISFIKAIENSRIITKTLGSDFLKYCSFGFGKEYVNSLWKMILGMTQRDEKKYVDAIKSNGGFLVSPEDYILLYKYIALCFSGQLNYETSDFWSDINTVQRLQVDYLINSRFRRKNEIQKLVANCIFQFKGNVPDSGNYIEECL